MLNYIYNPTPTKKYDEKTIGHFAFYSFKTLSECNIEITEKIIKNQKHMDKLFSLLKDNSDKNLTSRGYF